MDDEFGCGSSLVVIVVVGRDEDRQRVDDEAKNRTNEVD